ncbi:unnamed protein product [Pylaiella littoralis]
MTFNLYMNVMATRLNIDYLSSLSLTLQCKSQSVATFETEFDCGLSRKRKLLGNARRKRAVGFMYSELRRDGSPFRLDNKEGEEKIVAQDGRVAKLNLEEALLRARATSEKMFRDGVCNLVPDVRRLPGDGQGMAKRVKLPTFSDGIAKKIRSQEPKW